jgi:hypothetical protein
MDDIVKAAIKKWPNVPNCFDWLGLDARGDWYLRDAGTQAAGPFPRSKGSRITHEKLRDFIQRNYEHDAQGAWFFQNGPQRVYVALELAPLVIGVRRQASPAAQGAGAPGFQLETHTGQLVQSVRGIWLDELGHLYLETEHGLGVVRSLDMDAAADAIEARGWVPEDISSAELPGRFGFVLRPQQAG